MPNYDYICEKCGHGFEIFQNMSAQKLTDCPKKSCDGAVRRLLGRGAALIFKGSGFYETDYKNAGKAKPEKAEPSAPSSESKPAASGCCGGGGCGCH